MKEEITIKSESNLVEESSTTLIETGSEEKREETLESMQVTTEEFSSVQVSRQEESEFHIETKSTSEIISQSSENKESVGEILDSPSGEKKSGEDNDITDDSDAEHDGNEKEE